MVQTLSLVLTVVLLQQNPIVVDVIKPPEAAPDISIQYVLGMFMMAGVLLVFAGVGGVIVGVLYVLYRRHRDATAPPPEAGHNRLRI